MSVTGLSLLFLYEVAEPDTVDLPQSVRTISRSRSGVFPIRSRAASRICSPLRAGTRRSGRHGRTVPGRRGSVRASLFRLQFLGGAGHTALFAGGGGVTGAGAADRGVAGHRLGGGRRRSAPPSRCRSPRTGPRRWRTGVSQAGVSPGRRGAGLVEGGAGRCVLQGVEPGEAARGRTRRHGKPPWPCACWGACWTSTPGWLRPANTFRRQDVNTLLKIPAGRPRPGLTAARCRACGAGSVGVLGRAAWRARAISARRVSRGVDDVVDEAALGGVVRVHQLAPGTP